MHKPIKKLVERLRTDGIGTNLPNEFHYDAVKEIERGIALIEEHKRKSDLRVVLLGEVLQSVSRFETNYVLYEQRRAKELQDQGGFGRIISEGYLRRQKRDLLVESSSQFSPVAAYH
ncbi:MAG: hypothetical protein AABX70_00020 [Nanoarchaeota archaeon]